MTSTGSSSSFNDDSPVIIRCRGCHAAIPFRGGTEHDRCDCGQVYRLKKPLSKGRLGSLSKRARRLARKHDIDLPSAYSIQLEILTLEQVQDVQSRGQLLQNDEAASESRARVRYDRGFDKAVEDGFLTPQQALERGNREALSRRLAERHALGVPLAYDVADNRTPLIVALRKQRNDLRAAVVPRIGGEYGWARRGLASAAIAAIALGAWVLLGSRGHEDRVGPTPPEIAPAASATAHGGATAVSRERTLRSSTHVTRDRLGRVTRIVGPDPRSVTIAFCEAAEPVHHYEVLDVKPAIPPEVRSRRGILRDPVERTFHTLRIRQDRESRRWSVGDGTTPIRADLAAPATIEATFAR